MLQKWYHLFGVIFMLLIFFNFREVFFKGPALSVQGESEAVFREQASLTKQQLVAACPDTHQEYEGVAGTQALVQPLPWRVSPAGTCLRSHWENQALKGSLCLEHCSEGGHGH